MEIVVWQAIPCKQAYPHAPLFVPSMGYAGVFGHKGITITSIDLFHNIFPLAENSPTTVNWLMSYNNQLPIV